MVGKNDVQVIQPEKIDLPKADAHQMKFLPIESVERLLAQPNISSQAGLRDKSHPRSALFYGLRVSELVGLSRDQINLQSQEFGVIGKGRRQRVVFLSDRAKQWLERWLNSRNDNWDPVFIRFSGKQPDIISDGEEMRLTTRSVQRLVDRYCRKASVAYSVSSRHPSFVCYRFVEQWRVSS